jgi:hypothetical protein
LNGLRRKTPDEISKIERGREDKSERDGGKETEERERSIEREAEAERQGEVDRDRDGA